MDIGSISSILGLSIDEINKLKMEIQKILIISRVGRIRIWSVEEEIPAKQKRIVVRQCKIYLKEFLLKYYE